MASNLKQLVRVYVNVKRLAQASTNARIIGSAADLEDFVRGFNGKELHFDCVDVGSTKDRADGKIQGMLFRGTNLMATDHEQHFLRYIWAIPTVVKSFWE